jgi:quinoprotein glucose dehydrogenase
MPWILKLGLRPKPKNVASSQELYAANCASCHGQDRHGSGSAPALTEIGKKYTEDQMEAIVREGRVRMPSFSNLGSASIHSIVHYLATGAETEVSTDANTQLPYPLKYKIDVINKFYDPDGYPAVKPPWGTLNAINLDTGKYVWKIPFGEYPELAAKGFRNTGTESYGGPLVTAGGLLFIGASTRDRKFHAYDKSTGKLLWEAVMSASGCATPATYEIDGRQFVVVAAGGGVGWGPRGGGLYVHSSFVAFALPN